MHKQNLFQTKAYINAHIHIIGIGGIGVSALAQFLQKSGAYITGSDAAKNPLTDKLRAQGMSIFLGQHKANHVSPKTNAIIYSPAVPQGNVERLRAKRMGIPQYSYPEALGHVLETYHAICVAGTHGKSTTSSLLAHIAVTAHKDPSVIVGTLMKNLNNANVRKGKSKWFILEADEYKESFLAYHPYAVILTRVEKDHLDYYKNLGHILRAFKTFVCRVPTKGFLVLNTDDANSNKLKRACKGKVVTYGIRRGTIRAKHITYDSSGTNFAIIDKKKLYTIRIPLVGLHNVYNSLAAWAAARQIGISPLRIQKGFRTFKGIWRRFDVVGKINSITFIDDYAHHPTEIRACINSLKQAYPNRRCIMVFQPHQEDRLKKLFSDFPKSFFGIEKLFLLPVYQVAGRKTQARKTSVDLEIACKKEHIDVAYINNGTLCAQKMAKTLMPHDVVAFVGAGDIIDIRKEVMRLLKKSHGRHI